MENAVRRDEMQQGREWPPLLPARSGFIPSTGSGLRKAAVLVAVLGDDCAKHLLQGLSADHVSRLSTELAALGEIGKEEITDVVTEFYGLVATEDLSVRGGSEYARKLMTEAFGAKRADELLSEQNKQRERMVGDLAMLQQMEPQQLSKFLEGESPQTVALVLAHLEIKRGAEVLTHLPEELKLQAVKKLAVMKHFPPETAQKIALVLHRRIEGVAKGGRQNLSGAKSSADLLNGLSQNASKQILDKIEENDPEIAFGIRNLMFTFDDFLTVPAQSIRELVSAADKKVLATALKGASDNVQAHLLSAMSSRAVQMLREDMETMERVRNREVQAAQQQLLTLARNLEKEGKMFLKIEADDERIA